MKRILGYNYFEPHYKEQELCSLDSEHVIIDRDAYECVLTYLTEDAEFIGRLEEIERKRKVTHKELDGNKGVKNEFESHVKMNNECYNSVFINQTHFRELRKNSQITIFDASGIYDAIIEEGNVKMSVKIEEVDVNDNSKITGKYEYGTIMRDVEPYNYILTIR